MGDAEIIPIGTRGRPGRGTGRTKPSAAARSLAGDTSVAREARQPAQPSGGGHDAAAAGPSEGASAPRAVRRPPPKRQRPAEPPVVPAPAPATTRDRAPLAGVPAADWLAAFQHAAREVFGEHWEPQLARFLAFLRRRLTGDYAVDEYGFDQELTQRFVLAALRPIAEKWFRIEVRGADNIPAEGGALIVSNHSGTVPVDGLMTMYTVHAATGRHLRPLGADLVFQLPGVAPLARKAGHTLACNPDAERLLSSGELVGVWPEGFKGIGKPFSERYKLQRFGRGGFVSAALRTGKPIIPCSIVGAEEIYPIIGNAKTLARLLGLPYAPITPFFPLLGPLGIIPLPSKWIIEFGEPIETAHLGPAAADDPMLVFNVADQVRETIQQTLYRLLMRRKSVFL